MDLATTVGSLSFPNPIMTASGTAGYGTELAAYGDLGELGAVVTKSLAVFEWGGNPAPRIHAAGSGMLNSVGLAGPGVAAWLERDLPALAATGARVVASVWGRTVDEFAAAAEAMAAAPPGVVAVEVNVSCPNLQGKGMFAQSPETTRAAVAEVVVRVGRPCWAKLTPAVADLPAIAAAARDAGAEAVTLVNTMPALALDPASGRPRLGAGSGGLSGPALHPVAVKAVFDVHAALPGLPIVGVGGVATGADAAELLAAGASAVQVGTATFADPRAPWSVLTQLIHWLRTHDAAQVSGLVARAHRHEQEAVS